MLVREDDKMIHAYIYVQKFPYRTIQKQKNEQHQHLQMLKKKIVLGRFISNTNMMKSKNKIHNSNWLNIPD